MRSEFFSLSRLSGLRALVFGDYMEDEYIQGSVARISPEAPVPVLNVRNRRRHPGGAGNVVLNLLALGAHVAALGLLGQDEAGARLQRVLQEAGTDTRGLFFCAEAVTSVKTRLTAQNQQLLRFDQEEVSPAPPAFCAFLDRELEGLLQNTDVVILSDYGKGGVTEETAQRVIRAAAARGIPVTVDPKGRDYRKYRGATVCTPNLKELQQAAGRPLDSEEEIRAAGAELCRSLSLEHMLVTRSEKGMSLINGATGEKRDYPAVSKEVTDVTGAGDTVISLFSLCLAANASLDSCCTLANLAASVVVSKFGAAVATPAEIDALRQPKNQERKWLTLPEAVAVAEKARQRGQRIVFTNGCFDLVHAGHISSFRQARQFGDLLFVGLNSDASIRRIKGESRPIVGEVDRAALLSALEPVDCVVLFEEDTPEELIRAIRPDVLVKGRDWEGKPVAGGDFVRENGGELRFIDLTEGLSTSLIIEKILRVYGGNA